MRTQEELHARSLLLGIDWTDDTVVGRIRFGKRVNAGGKTIQRQYRPVSMEKAFAKFSTLVPASVRLVLVGVQCGGAGPSGCRLNAWNQHVHRFAMAHSMAPLQLIFSVSLASL